MVTFLVTGGTSFIGKAVVSDLVMQGFGVGVVVRSIDSKHLAALYRAGVRVHFGDLSDPRTTQVLPRYDVTIHASGTSAVGGSTTQVFIRDNVIASAHVARYARQNDCSVLVGLSSISVYGRRTGGVVSQMSTIQRPDAYGQSKLMGEHELLGSARACPVVILRLPGVVGLGAHRIWLSRILELARRGEVISVRNLDSAFNNVVHISDLTKLLARAPHFTTSTTGCYPLASTDPLPVRNVVQGVIDSCHSTSTIVEVPSGEPSFTIDDLAARVKIGYTSLATIEAVSRYVRESCVSDSFGSA